MIQKEAERDHYYPHFIYYKVRFIEHKGADQVLEGQGRATKFIQVPRAAVKVSHCLSIIPNATVKSMSGQCYFFPSHF